MDSRVKKVESDTSSTMADILKTLKLMQSGSPGVAITPGSSTAIKPVSSSECLPPLEEVQQRSGSQESHLDDERQDDIRSESPIFKRLAQKRKAPEDDDNANVGKKIKVRHHRTKSSTPAQRQEQRERFTSALVSIPSWLPDNWNVAAYITNRFFWVHEAARNEMFSHKRTKGQNYPCYRVPFNDLAISFVKEYDDERQKTYESKKSNPDLALVEILPWYKLHSNFWKRPMIHPKTAKTSTQDFAFHTNIQFMDNFLSDIGGKLFSILFSKSLPYVEYSSNAMIRCHQLKSSVHSFGLIMKDLYVPIYIKSHTVVFRVIL